MKKKIIITVLILLSIIAIGFLVFNKSDNYEIRVDKVDDRSPDRKLIVLKNGKEFKDYKHIKYDNKKEIILCYQKNPTVNVFELEDKLVIVLSNDKEVLAKVIRNDEK